MREFELTGRGLRQTASFAVQGMPLNILCDEERQSLLVDVRPPFGGASCVRVFRCVNGDWPPNPQTLQLRDLHNPEIRIGCWTQLDSQRIALFDAYSNDLLVFEYA